MQTLWPPLLRRSIPLDLKREEFELSDGDFVEIDWPAEPNESRPIVLILHGLQGGIHSLYVRGFFRTFHEAGMLPVVMHFRGCGGKPNRKPRAYHSGDTGDFPEFIAAIREKYPGRAVCAVGVSLGGNALLKWLGETGENNPLTCAMSASVPFDLDAAGVKLESGASRIYQHHLISSLKKVAVRKLEHGFKIEGMTMEKLEGMKTFRDFDNGVTSPLHGFKDADDYYRSCSSCRFLNKIGRPTLIVHSLDDPFLPPSAIPSKDMLSDFVSMEITKSGGHGGFVAGTNPFSPRYWMELRALRFILSHTGQST